MKFGSSRAVWLFCGPGESSPAEFLPVPHNAGSSGALLLELTLLIRPVKTDWQPHAGIHNGFFHSIL